MCTVLRHKPENIIKMTQQHDQELMQEFENMLWVNSPKEWTFKTNYFRDTLFVSISSKGKKNIHRSFHVSAIRTCSNDIEGIAKDCIDEMKTNG